MAGQGWVGGTFSNGLPADDEGTPPRVSTPNAVETDPAGPTN